MKISPRERDYFESQLEIVFRTLPQVVLGMLDEVPLYVEDYPAASVLEEMNIESPEGLLGLHTGIPLTKRSIEQSGYQPNHIFIYRLGLLRSVDDLTGRERDEELREQIRITILHELGHYHGLDEDELDALGYG